MIISSNNPNRPEIINALLSGDELTLRALTGNLPPLKILYKRLSSNTYYQFPDATGQLTPEECSKFIWRVAVVIPEEGCFVPAIANTEQDVIL